MVKHLMIFVYVISHRTKSCIFQQSMFDDTGGYTKCAIQGIQGVGVEHFQEPMLKVIFIECLTTYSIGSL